MGDESTLHRIASHCTEYEPSHPPRARVFSCLNTAMASEDYRCDWCVYWRDGNCSIYVDRTNTIPNCLFCASSAAALPLASCPMVASPRPSAWPSCASSPELAQRGHSPRFSSGLSFFCGRQRGDDHGAVWSFDYIENTLNHQRSTIGRTPQDPRTPSIQPHLR